MNIKYYVLYRNGHEDVISQTFTSEEEIGFATQLHDLIQESFREGTEGNISFGDGETEGSFIRISDVVRIRMEIEKGDAE